jgi:L-2-hydroxyglutarate oxidase
MKGTYDFAIIGAGILGSAIAYFISAETKSTIIVMEQAKKVANHTSSRNTGKVHAPFFYDPKTKRTFARAAFLGFDMWKKYCKSRSLPFKQDGVLEVATYDRGRDRLLEHLEWGYSNGLSTSELRLLERGQINELEPNVRSFLGLFCSRDASVDFGVITRNLVQDAKDNGAKIVTNAKVKKILRGDRFSLTTDHEEFATNFIINCAGGNALDVAHNMGIALDYVDLHFRGEYWEAPEEYRDLTKISVYSVPKFPEYPFLDPHWIVRVDGRREVGPNAVPVSSPYAYDWINNIKHFIPKTSEIVRSGARKIIFNRRFLSLAATEVKSSLFKTSMINRVREFLPQLKPSKFTRRGTAGVRSSLVDRNGKFVSDTLILKTDKSLHFLNYNSPGATGALPIAAMVVDQLVKDGIAKRRESRKKSLWDLQSVADQMQTNKHC